jgi:hypothetical protein
MVGQIVVNSTFVTKAILKKLLKNTLKGEVK